MVLSADQERMKSMIQEAVSALCRNGLLFDTEVSVEGLIGITIDKSNVFLVSIRDMISKEAEQSTSAETVAETQSDSNCSGDDLDDSASNISGDHSKKRSHRRHSRKRSSKRMSSDGEPEEKRYTSIKTEVEDDEDVVVIKEDNSDSEQFTNFHSYMGTSGDNPGVSGGQPSFVFPELSHGTNPQPGSSSWESGGPAPVGLPVPAGQLPGDEIQVTRIFAVCPYSKTILIQYWFI